MEVRGGAGSVGTGLRSPEKIPGVVDCEGRKCEVICCDFLVWVGVVEVEVLGVVVVVVVEAVEVTPVEKGLGLSNSKVGMTVLSMLSS